MSQILRPSHLFQNFSRILCQQFLSNPLSGSEFGPPFFSQPPLGGWRETSEEGTKGPPTTPPVPLSPFRLEFPDFLISSLTTFFLRITPLLFFRVSMLVTHPALALLQICHPIPVSAIPTRVFLNFFFCFPPYEVPTLRVLHPHPANPEVPDFPSPCV